MGKFSPCEFTENNHLPYWSHRHRRGGYPDWRCTIQFVPPDPRSQLCNWCDSSVCQWPIDRNFPDGDRTGYAGTCLLPNKCRRHSYDASQLDGGWAYFRLAGSSNLVPYWGRIVHYYYPGCLFHSGDYKYRA